MKATWENKYWSAKNTNYIITNEFMELFFISLMQILLNYGKHFYDHSILSLKEVQKILVDTQEFC